MAKAGKHKGGGGGGGRAEISRVKGALGQQSAAKTRQREHKGIKAGKGRGEQQVAEHAHRQGEGRSGDAAFIGGGNGRQQGIDKGDHPKERKALQSRPLHKDEQKGSGGVQRPFENGFVAGKHGGTSVIQCLPPGGRCRADEGTGLGKGVRSRYQRT